MGGSLCLDFVNTVGGRVGQAVLRDKLPDVRSLAAWSEAAGLLKRSEGNALTDSHRRRAIRLREAIYWISRLAIDNSKPQPRDMQVLSGELTVAGRHRRFIRDESAFRWKWDAPESPERFLWILAQSAADLLASDEVALLRQCGGEECGWLFLDTSRNHSRQWCDMKDCGNRAKVRRFREREQTSYSKVR